MNREAESGGWQNSENVYAPKFLVWFIRNFRRCSFRKILQKVSSAFNT
jgi:hypothetical protein